MVSEPDCNLRTICLMVGLFEVVASEPDCNLRTICLMVGLFEAVASEPDCNLFQPRENYIRSVKLANEGTTLMVGGEASFLCSWDLAAVRTAPLLILRLPHGIMGRHGGQGASQKFRCISIGRIIVKIFMMEIIMFSMWFHSLQEHERKCMDCIKISCCIMIWQFWK